MRKTLFCFLLLGFALATAARAATGYTRNVAIVVFDGVEVLDFAGPAEIFSAAGEAGAYGQQAAFNVYLVSKTREAIVSQGFIQIVPNHSTADAPRPDILVLPGGDTSSVTADPEFMAWIGSSAAEAENVLTVCTGALIAGRLGLLDGHDVTTFYRAVPGLAKRFPNARVQPGRRFIDSGKLITTAGVSAGIDGSLHLVARSLGRYVADRTAEYTEYSWAPQSYTATTYPQLNPRLDERGRRLQLAEIDARDGRPEAAIATYRALVESDRADADVWLELGGVLHEFGRYREAIAAYAEAAKGEAQRGFALFRIACGHSRLGESALAIETAAQAIEAGFRFRPYYETSEDLAGVRDDPRFQALLTGL